MTPDYYPQPTQRGNSVYYAFDYLIGLMVFGFIYWILNGILPFFEVLSSTGLIHDLANFLWWFILIIYMTLGPFYLWNRLREWS